MKSNKKKYVVGYSGSLQNAIYTSKRTWSGGMENMTYKQALQLAKKMPSTNAKVSIFELVPVLTAKPKDL